jgi:ATP-dependent Lhr-like helicase
VHAPWALILADRIENQYGLDGQVMAADDGIVLRLPDDGSLDSLPDLAHLISVDPDEVTAQLTRLVGGSALFASRFRECAARALLFPRRDPRRRSPLWQQRQRSAQLLSVAASYPDFPIVLETVRECLQDVYDVPALTALLRDIDSGAVAVTEVSTDAPSPFARSLLFGYVAAFLYEGDSPWPNESRRPWASTTPC